MYTDSRNRREYRVSMPPTETRSYRLLPMNTVMHPTGVAAARCGRGVPEAAFTVPAAGGRRRVDQAGSCSSVRSSWLPSGFAAS